MPSFAAFASVWGMLQERGGQHIWCHQNQANPISRVLDLPMEKFCSLNEHKNSKATVNGLASSQLTQRSEQLIDSKMLRQFKKCGENFEERTY
jgi:hypothetical protein